MPHSLRINFQLRSSKKHEDAIECKDLQEELDQALVLHNAASDTRKRCL